MSVISKTDQTCLLPNLYAFLQSIYKQFIWPTKQWMHCCI